MILHDAVRDAIAEAIRSRPDRPHGDPDVDAATTAALNAVRVVLLPKLYLAKMACRPTVIAGYQQVALDAVHDAMMLLWAQKKVPR